MIQTHAGSYLAPLLSPRDCRKTRTPDAARNAALRMKGVEWRVDRPYPKNRANATASMTLAIRTMLRKNDMISFLSRFVERP
jgi:hypothetical protein